MFILEATINVLGFNNDGFLTSKSSIQRIRTLKWNERVKNIKIYFQNEVPDVVTSHWEGKLFPALSAQKSKEEHLPIVFHMDLKNNSFLYRDWIVPQTKNRRRLFGRRS